MNTVGQNTDSVLSPFKRDYLAIVSGHNDIEPFVSIEISDSEAFCVARYHEPTYTW